MDFSLTQTPSPWPVSELAEEEAGDIKSFMVTLMESGAFEDEPEDHRQDAFVPPLPVPRVWFFMHRL